MPIKNNHKFDRAEFDRAWQKLSDRSFIPLHILPIIPSTNQYLWELIEQNDSLPLAVIARQQTAGKGQWGRQWQSLPGGLYLSVGIKTHLKSELFPHLVMATACGIAEALRKYNVPVSIKWFNDLILLGKKLGGIKIETRTKQEFINHAVVGVGINWTNTVPAPGISLQSYYQTSTQPRIVSLEQLTAITIYGILSGYQSYLEVGIEQIKDNYLKLFYNLRQKVTFEGCSGIVTGITTNGELKITLRSPGATTEICLAPGQISLGYN